MACRLENIRLPLYADLVPQHEREVLRGGSGQSQMLAQSSSAHSTEENHRGFFRAQDGGVYYRDISDRVQ